MRNKYLIMKINEKTIRKSTSPGCDTVGDAQSVKNNIVYILCKDILYTLCKHIVYKFLLIEALIFLLNEDRCESDKPVSSGILAYLRQSSR